MKAGSTDVHGYEAAASGLIRKEMAEHYQGQSIMSIICGCNWACMVVDTAEALRCPGLVWWSAWQCWRIACKLSLTQSVG